MISSRGKNIVVMSQFNINGSRGADAGKFVSDYVSRDSATDVSTSYVPDPSIVPVQGDGVAFTLDRSAISRKETLSIADHVQDLHLTGKRAIQQMVISFDHDYLLEQALIPENTEIIKKGNYRHMYDDVRLRNAVRTGLQSLVDSEGYRDGKAVACVQWDTRHLHVHAVIYEDANKISRKRGGEEKGVIKESSFNQMLHDVDRNLSLTRSVGNVPNAKSLLPNISESKAPKPLVIAPEPVYVNTFLQVLEERKRKEALLKPKVDKTDANRIAHMIIDENGIVKPQEPQEPQIEK